MRWTYHFFNLQFNTMCKYSAKQWFSAIISEFAMDFFFHRLYELHRTFFKHILPILVVKLQISSWFRVPRTLIKLTDNEPISGADYASKDHIIWLVKTRDWSIRKLWYDLSVYNQAGADSIRFLSVRDDPGVTWSRVVFVIMVSRDF